MKKKQFLKQFDEFLEANEIHFVNPVNNEDKNLILDFIFYVALKAQRQEIMERIDNMTENWEKRFANKEEFNVLDDIHKFRKTLK